MNLSTDQILVVLVEKDLEIRQLRQMVQQLTEENKKLKDEKAKRENENTV